MRHGRGWIGGAFSARPRLWLAAFPSRLRRGLATCRRPRRATVAAVLDGETLKLADGRIVKLIGAKAPIAPLGWRGDDPWPFVEEAKAALEALPPTRRSNSGSAEAAPTGTAIFSPRSSSLRGKAASGSRTSSWEGASPGSTLSPTTAPARPNFSRARKRRGGSGSGFGPLPPIASKTRATWSAWGASFIPIS